MSLLIKVAASLPHLWINHHCKKQRRIYPEFFSREFPISGCVKKKKKKHFCFAKLAGEMSLRWIMDCWGGNSSAVDMLCLARPPLGICGAVSPWWWRWCFACILLWGDVEEWLWASGAEVSGELWGLLGSAVPRLWFRTALCAPKSSWCRAPCFPGHGELRDSRNALFRWFRLGFCAFENKGRELPATVVDLSQLHHKTVP